MATPAADPFSSSEGTAEKALSFLSKGWQDVRDSADADIRLMRARANNFKSIADREIENFLNSGTPSFPPTSPPQSASTSISELEFLKRIRPKLSELRSAYSSPEFGKKVLERWGGPESSGARLGIDLSSIRSALVTEVGVGRTVWYPEWERRKRTGLTARSVWWKGEEEDEEEETETKAWDPIRKLKTRLRELERKSHSYEILENIKNSEFVEKVKLSLKSLCADSQGTKDVPPLDVPELLAYLIKQSGPLVEQLGFNRDICDKMVDALYGKRKGQLIRPSVSMGDLESADSNDDELESRINAVLQSTGHHTDRSFWDNRIHDDSDNKRHVAIVTTASLPWMTGTAVNPLFRAAYLAKSAEQNVTLLVPWLCRSDQELVYPNNLTFSSPEDQESYIRNWLEERVGFKTDFKISFYPGKFSKERRSIIPAGDTTQFISSKEADIAILEEPEHLNWYHHGKRWTDKFNHVIGVVHTNYLEYIKREKNGALKAFFVTHINNWVIRAYCDKVLRLSAATQDVPKSTVCNVHGVNPKFLKIGEKVASEKEEGQTTFSKGAYFLGKMVWAKGYKELIDLMAEHKSDLDGFKLDVYGSGEDSNEVQSAAKNLNLNLNFMKGRDHADDSLHGYKVFINPSISDVLCTATAEALAMGKFVVCADHPSNDFFKAFPNCLTYKSSEDFVARIREAMAGEPRSLTPEQRYRLSWEAATKRFLEYSELNKVLNGKSCPEHFTRGDDSKKIRKSVSMPSLSEVADGGLAFAHYCLTASEILRLSTGAIPNTRDYGTQHSKDLKLHPPQVQNPVYGW